MNSSSSVVRSSRKFAWFGCLALLSLLLMPGCHGAPESFLAQLDEARQTAADIRVQLTRETDASNRAVMADTDESSVAFAREAEATTQMLENDRAALASVLGSLNYATEIQALAQFDRHFAEYRKLDREILALAVENTNLKAQALSFGPAREAADAFRTSLEGLLPLVPDKNRCRAETLVDKALLAVREIQVLQAPHIAERDDTAMTRFENEMGRLKATTRSALNELSSLGGSSASASLSTAFQALERFDKVDAEIIALSRRNTNVRSLDLALRARPPLTAACDESLRALQAALAKEGVKGTR